MRRFLPVLLLFLSASSFAQINFLDAKTDWETLSKKAKSENKLIFVHFEDGNCGQCNSVATEGFSKPELKEKYKQNFIALRVNVNSQNGAAIKKRLGVSANMVSTYSDADGNLLHQFFGTTNNPYAYIEQADIALGMRKEKPLTAFEKDYQNRERSAAFLKQYILRRRKAQIPSDTLLEQYVGQISIDSLSSFEVVKFIYEQAPVVNSRAYRLMRAATPHSTIDSVFKKAGPATAVRYNQAIIQRSMQKAIATNDITLAFDTRNFLVASYGNDFRLANFGGHKLMLRFYFETKDTITYIQEAKEFIERNYMRISIDSLERLDEQERQKQLKINPQMQGTTTVTVKMVPPSQFYHMELNERAWHFYEMAKTRADLEMATIWSKRSIEWFEELGKSRNTPKDNPAYLDTYAHLLYKLGKKEEAIAWQTKAVEAQKITKRQDDGIVETLAKMKAGTL